MKSRIALALTALAATLLVAELVARVAYRPPPVLRAYHPFAYRVPPANVVAEVRGVSGDRVVIELNELGMRGPGLSASAQAETTLVFLGGSTTENFSLPVSATFPEQAAAALRRSTGRSVRVFNAGSSAATVAVSLGRLQHEILDLRPSLVVVMHGINDLLGGFHPHYRADGRHLPRPAPASARPVSYLRSWLGELLRPVGAGFTDTRARRRLAGPGDFPSLLAFRRDLRSFVAVAGAHRVPVLLLTQPTMYEVAADPTRFELSNRLAREGLPLPNAGSLSLGMRLFNEAVLSLGGVDGARAFDLSERLPRSWDLFLDECHLSAAGNARIAEEIVVPIERILRESGPP